MNNSSFYTHIGGERYETKLLKFAEEHGAKGHEIKKANAEALWKLASKGNKVTDTQRDTLQFILEHYKMCAAAHAYLTCKLEDKPYKAPEGYDKYINGVRYKRKLLDAAKELAEANGGSLDVDDVMKLLDKANDGKGVTETEKLTLQKIAEMYRLNQRARDWFEGHGIQARPSITDAEPGLLKRIWQRMWQGRADDDQPALEDDPATSQPQAKRRKRNHNPSNGSLEANLAPALQDLLG